MLHQATSSPGPSCQGLCTRSLLLQYPALCPQPGEFLFSWPEARPLGVTSLLLSLPPGCQHDLSLLPCEGFLTPSHCPRWLSASSGLQCFMQHRAQAHLCLPCCYLLVNSFAEQGHLISLQALESSIPVSSTTPVDGILPFREA
jgi:hypothetical protein